MRQCSKCCQEYDQDKVDELCCDHCGMPRAAPAQQQKNTGSPKLLDSLNNIYELLRIGDYSTAEMCVIILIKKLRAGARKRCVK